MSFFSHLKKIITAKFSRKFVSEIDKFLVEFNEKQTKKSASQIKEITKYKRIFKLRDHCAVETENEVAIWEKF